MYVVALVAELEKKRLLPTGQTAHLKSRVQMSTRAQDYRRQNPVPKPMIAYTAEEYDAFYHPNGRTSSNSPSSSNRQGTSLRVDAISHPASTYVTQEIRPRYNPARSSNNAQTRGSRQGEGSGCCIVM